MVKRENEKYDFQIVHHYIDLTELTLNKLPVSSLVFLFKLSDLTVWLSDCPTKEMEVSQSAEPGWFRTSSQALQQPEEGKDWNTYFQYEAHKNLLKELPEDQEEWKIFVRIIQNPIGCVLLL